MDSLTLILFHSISCTIGSQGCKINAPSQHRPVHSPIIEPPNLPGKCFSCLHGLQVQVVADAHYTIRVYLGCSHFELLDVYFGPFFDRAGELLSARAPNSIIFERLEYKCSRCQEVVRGSGEGGKVGLNGQANGKVNGHANVQEN